MKTPKIEKDIPMYPQTPTEYDHVFKKMGVGDSFKVDNCEVRSRAMNCSRIFRNRLDVKEEDLPNFRSRKQADGSYRIWRIS